MIFSMFILIASFFLPAHAHEKEESVNNGEDIMRPLSRIDLRAKYQRGVDAVYGNASIFTFHWERAFDFESGWKASLRTDLPLEWFWCPNGNCSNSHRMGDSNVQGLLITPQKGKWQWAVGMEVIFPTAGDNLYIGDGKYQLLPTAALRYDLSSFQPGAFAGILARYAFDCAGYRNAPHISQVYLQPFFNLNLPYNFFLSMAPEMRYDGLGKHWFIPYDVMIGWIYNEKTVISLEYETAITNAFPQYLEQLEFRIGMFF